MHLESHYERKEEGTYIVLLDVAPDRTWMKIYAEVQQVNAIQSSNF